MQPFVVFLLAFLPLYQTASLCTHYCSNDAECSLGASASPECVCSNKKYAGPTCSTKTLVSDPWVYHWIPYRAGTSWQGRGWDSNLYFFGSDRHNRLLKFDTSSNSFQVIMSEQDWGRGDAVTVTNSSTYVFDHNSCKASVYEHETTCLQSEFLEVMVAQQRSYLAVQGNGQLTHVSGVLQGLTQPETYSFVLPDTDDTLLQFEVKQHQPGLSLHSFSETLLATNFATVQDTTVQLVFAQTKKSVPTSAVATFKGTHYRGLLNNQETNVNGFIDVYLESQSQHSSSVNLRSIVGAVAGLKGPSSWKIYVYTHDLPYTDVRNCVPTSTQLLTTKNIQFTQGTVWVDSDQKIGVNSTVTSSLSTHIQTHGSQLSKVVLQIDNLACAYLTEVTKQWGTTVEIPKPDACSKSTNPTTTLTNTPCNKLVGSVSLSQQQQQQIILIVHQCDKFQLQMYSIDKRGQQVQHKTNRVITPTFDLSRVSHVSVTAYATDKIALLAVDDDNAYTYWDLLLPGTEVITTRLVDFLGGEGGSSSKVTTPTLLYMYDTLWLVQYPLLAHLDMTTKKWIFAPPKSSMELVHNGTVVGHRGTIYSYGGTNDRGDVVPWMYSLDLQLYCSASNGNEEECKHKGRCVYNKNDNSCSQSAQSHTCSMNNQQYPTDSIVSNNEQKCMCTHHANQWSCWAHTCYHYEEKKPKSPNSTPDGFPPPNSPDDGTKPPSNNDKDNTNNNFTWAIVVIVLIALVIFIVGAWWLYSTRKLLQEHPSSDSPYENVEKGPVFGDDMELYNGGKGDATQYTVGSTTYPVSLYWSDAIGETQEKKAAGYNYDSYDVAGST